MTTIRVICSNCKSKLDIRADLAGSTRRCPKCKTEFKVPAPGEAPPAAAEEPLVPAQKPSAPAEKTPVPALAAPLGEDDSKDESADPPASPPETRQPSASRPTAAVDDGDDDDELPIPSPDALLPAGLDSNDDDAEEDEDDELAAPTLDVLPPAAPDSDDDDDDYMPSFVTETAGKKESSGEKASAKSAPKPAPADEPDDDGPVLSIPKVSHQPRPNFQPFDPDEFLSELEPPGGRKTPAPAAKGRSSRTRQIEDFDDGDSDVRPNRPKPGGARDFNLPSPEKTGLSDPVARTEGGTKDRAQAARELRQALKDSALKAPEEKEKVRGGVGFDVTLLFSEIGIKGIGIFAGTLLFAVALYFLSYQMLVGGPRLPPLGQVAGTVTLDGAPFAGATVYFAPLEVDVESGGKRKLVPRTSFAVSDDKGQYKLMYQEGIPGAAVGKCRVWIIMPPPQTAQEFSVGTANYKEVVSGKNPNIDFALTAPKKRR